MKKIELSNGKFALIDNRDFNSVSKFKWSYEPSGCNNGYAMRKDKNNKSIRMHRFILGEKFDGIVDHINGNGLDNRRKNIRISNRSQNALNTNKFKRYYFDKKRKRFISKIRILGVTHYLGSFKTKKEAILRVKNFLDPFI